jgi:hypothetical protein
MVSPKTGCEEEIGFGSFKEIESVRKIRRNVSGNQDPFMRLKQAHD